MAVGGVDHQHVGAHGHQCLRLGGRVAVDADGGGDAQPTVGVDGGLVDRRAQRALAGDAADEPARVVDHGRNRQSLARQAVEDLVGRGAVLDDHEVAAHHVLQLGEAVEADGIVLGEDAGRRAVVTDDDECAVGPLVDQAERIADGVGRAQRDRRLVHDVARLHVVDDPLDHVERDVLGQHGEPAATRHGLGHASAGNGGHVGDHDRDRRAEAVGRAEVDVKRDGTDERLGTMNTSL